MGGDWNESDQEQEQARSDRNNQKRTKAAGTEIVRERNREIFLAGIKISQLRFTLLEMVDGKKDVTRNNGQEMRLR